MVYIAVVSYLLMFSVANIVVYHFGVWSMPFNAFIIIGIDYFIRELVHVRLGTAITVLMVISSAAISLALSPDSIMISIAATVSFSISSVLSTILMGRIGSWKSAMICCAIDSVIFPTIAFWSWMIVPISVQFLAKFGGYLFWKELYRRFLK